MKRIALMIAAIALSVAASAADVDIRIILPADIAPGIYGRVDLGAARRRRRRPSTSTSRRGTPRTGASTAHATTPAASPCTS